MVSEILLQHSMTKGKYEDDTLDINLTPPLDDSAKAVADGSVMWEIEQSVVSRVVRFSYGTDVAPVYNPIIPQHQGRKKGLSRSGMFHVSGGWSEIMKRVSSNLLPAILGSKGREGNIIEVW